MLNKGIHPRYLHALINVPLLFGPLCIVVYCAFLRRVKQQFQAIQTAEEYVFQHFLIQIKFKFL